VASVSEDFIARYLAELRARLRTPPERAADILAEAEDHLRESMAAGEAAGMSEQEAQQAAISAFGTVRAVARANLRPAGVVVQLGLAASNAAGLYLLTVSAASFALYFWMRDASCRANLSPGCQLLDHQGYGLGPPAVWAGCGAAGLALLAGHHIARRVRRRRLRGRSEVPIRSYPLGAAFSFITLAVILVVLGSVTRLPQHPLPWALLPGALVVAVGYLVQAVRGQIKLGRATRAMR
jgi:hypothetical protein